MDCRMDGRVALVTGSSRGLGRAMVLAFAGSGAKVAVVGRRSEVVEETVAEIEVLAPGTAAGFSADVAERTAIDTLVDDVERTLGPIDILVNNAGTSRRLPFMEISDDLWAEDLELKLFGAIRTTRRVLPGMMERGWGRIINVLNVGAKAPPAGGAPTAVSRAAGMALTKVLAGEGAPRGVLVNALLVGKIESDQHRQRWMDAGTQESYEAYLERIAAESEIPLGRVGTAEEFANIACFLCSDAGSYITGCAINVDGGVTPVP